MSDVRRKAENAEFFAKAKAYREEHPEESQPARWGFSESEIAARAAARAQQEKIAISIRSGQATPTPYGVVGPVAPRVPGEVPGEFVKTPEGGYRHMLNPLQQTAKLYPELGKVGPKNTAFVQMYKAEQEANNGVAPDPLDVAARWKTAETAKKQAGTAAAAPAGSITPEKNDQFRDFHRTDFDPDSKVDRKKLGALPALPSVKAAPVPFRTGEATNTPLPAAPAAEPAPLAAAPAPLAAAPGSVQLEINRGDVEDLRADPTKAAAFDEWYGEGQASVFLNASTALPKFRIGEATNTPLPPKFRTGEATNTPLPAAPAAAPGSVRLEISRADVEALRADPTKADRFDERYGDGQAKAFLTDRRSEVKDNS